jgi:hypothetical protein
LPSFSPFFNCWCFVLIFMGKSDKGFGGKTQEARLSEKAELLNWTTISE